MKLGRYTAAIGHLSLSERDRLAILDAEPVDAVMTIWRESRFRRWRIEIWRPGDRPRSRYIGKPDERLRILVAHVIREEAPIAQMA